MSPEKGEAIALPHPCDPVVGFDFYESPERTPHTPVGGTVMYIGTL